MTSGSQRAPLLLFLVGAATTIILMLLFAYAPDLRGDISNEGDAVSRSASASQASNSCWTYRAFPPKSIAVSPPMKKARPASPSSRRP